MEPDVADREQPALMEGRRTALTAGGGGVSGVVFGAVFSGGGVTDGAENSFADLHEIYCLVAHCSRGRHERTTIARPHHILDSENEYFYCFQKDFVLPLGEYRDFYPAERRLDCL